MTDTQEGRTAPVIVDDAGYDGIIDPMVHQERDCVTRGCRSVIGEVRSGLWRYCQEPTKDGSSYCESHHSQYYTNILSGKRFILKEMKRS